MTTLSKLYQRVDGIPHGGWWSTDGRNAFRGLAKDLLESDWPEDRIIDFLEAAYGAVAGEFGG